MAGKGQENTGPSKISPSSRLLHQIDKREKYADIFLFFMLLAFGIYHAIIYWGHQVVPHFDFECFAAQGRQILSLKLPNDYKRLPLVGILQVLLGRITGGESPDFHGGWLLNSIVHPLTAVLLWLAGRKVIGRAAIWFAIIAIINPWGLQLLTESIAETTLLFFIWATLYLIFIRSRWAYLAASLTTMVRYEGAALILCVFVMDMIDSRDKKQRIVSFIYAVLASVPLALWMLGTMLSWQTAGPTHYLNIFGKEYTSQFAEGLEERIGFVNHAAVLWQVGFSQLFVPIPAAGSAFTGAFFKASKTIALVSFLFGSAYGLYKRQWKILVLLLFALSYFCIHSRYPYLLPRFYTTIFAIVVLICIYGLLSCWKLIKDRLTKGTIITAQIAASIIAIIWALVLQRYLLEIKSMSKASVSLPYAAMLAVCMASAIRRFAYKGSLLTGLVIFTLMTLMVVSNQFVVDGVVGNGERDIEFKYLLDWYKANAKKGEKLVTTAPSILGIMAPKYKDCFIHTNSFDANNPKDFVTECYKRNITYVAWDSREGLATTEHYYKYWKMANIAPLAAGRDIEPYQFITQLRVDKSLYINVYRLRYPPPGTK